MAHPMHVPAEGDVVVHHEEQHGRTMYVLVVTPGPGQMFFPSEMEAIAEAVRFAKQARVRAWLRKDGTDFVLLEDHRRPPGGRR